MLTLNQQIQLLKNIWQNHGQLSKGSFVFNEPPDYGAEEPLNYPFTGVNTQPFSIDGKMSKTNIVVYFADLVHQDTSNLLEVLSDLHLIAHDVISQYKYTLQNTYGVTWTAQTPLKDFRERWDDEVAGWECELSFEQFYDHSVCDLPTN